MYKKTLNIGRLNIRLICALVAVTIVVITTHFSSQASGLSFLNAGAKTQSIVMHDRNLINKSSPSSSTVNNSSKNINTSGLISQLAINVKPTSPLNQASTSETFNRSPHDKSSPQHIHITPTQPVTPVPPVTPTPPVTPVPPAITAVPANFTWDGYSWARRDWGGSPSYNGQWSPSNVIGPNSNNQVTLEVSNPTGSSPYSAEFDSNKLGWGYGTYTVVVDGDLSTLSPSLVFGNMFIYDSTVPVTANEIDAGEYSAWGSSIYPVTLSQTMYANIAGLSTPLSQSVDAPAGSVTTHQIIWTPTSVTINAYSGAGTTGPIILHSQWLSYIPVPQQEQVMFNFWVTSGNGGSPNSVPNAFVTIQDFTFTPL